MNTLLLIDEFLLEKLTPQMCEELKLTPAMFPWLSGNFYARVVGNPAKRRPGVMVGMMPGEGAAKLEVLVETFKELCEWLDAGLSPHLRKRPIPPTDEQPPAQVPRRTEEVVVATPPIPMEVVGAVAPLRTLAIPQVTPSPVHPQITLTPVVPRSPRVNRPPLVPPRVPLRNPNVVIPKQPTHHNPRVTPMVQPAPIVHAMIPAPVALPPPPTTPPPPPPVEAPAQNTFPNFPQGFPNFPQGFRDVQLDEDNLPQLPARIPPKEWPSRPDCVRITLELRNLIRDQLRSVRNPRYGITYMDLLEKLNERLRLKYRCMVGKVGDESVRKLLESWGFQSTQDRSGGTYMINLMWKD